jgi:hypothetical protein
VPQSVIEAAIERGLLEPESRAGAWELIQACYASMLSDATLNWLNQKRTARGRGGNSAQHQWLARAGASMSQMATLFAHVTALQDVSMPLCQLISITRGTER